MSSAGCGATFVGMEILTISPASHTPYADLDLLLNESDSDSAYASAARLPQDDAEQPDTVDAFNAQILAGLVSP
jgi:hypothetical protein